MADMSRLKNYQIPNVTSVDVLLVFLLELFKDLVKVLNLLLAGLKNFFQNWFAFGSETQE
jgi:hypothetical protein